MSLKANTLTLTVEMGMEIEMERKMFGNFTPIVREL
jgi:hypothetical protein